MKKLLLASAVMLFAWSLVSSEMRITPRGEPQALATADYGGVLYSTQTFGPVSGAGVGFSTGILNPSGSVGGVFYGVIFSSGVPQDFVDVYDASSTYNAGLSGPFVRLYNVATSTNGIGSASTYAVGFSGPPKPIRFGKGLLLRAGQATVNLITTLFYHEPF